MLGEDAVSIGGWGALLRLGTQMSVLCCPGVDMAIGVQV